MDGVDASASGLILTAVHQSETVPKIVAKLKAGGQQIDVNREIPRPTEAEFQEMQACLQELGVQLGVPGQAPGQGAAPGLGAGQPGAGREGFNQCLPERLRRFRATITTPEQTLRQVLDPPQTDIESTTYSIAGVDLGHREIGVVTPSLVAKGRFLRNAKEALVSTTYASRQGVAVGSTLDLNDSKLKVVGLVRPALGGQAADVYIALPKLQALAGQEGKVNVVLVRSDTGSDVAGVEQAIEQTFSSAAVASAKDVAGQITGSLVDAAKLSDRLGTVFALLAAVVGVPRGCPADALLRGQERAGDRHAQSHRLEAADRRPPDPGRVAGAGRGGRPDWHRARVGGSGRDRSRMSNALCHVLDVDDGKRPLRAGRRDGANGHRQRGAHSSGGTSRATDRVRRRRAGRARSRSTRWLACGAHAARRGAAEGGVTLYELRGAARFFQRGGQVVRAVDGVDLSISAGEVVAFEGPSGSGKTTLLQLLGALDRPSEGSVSFEGEDLGALSDDALAELRLRTFGFVFQQFNLIPTLTAVDNVVAGLAPMGVDDDDARSRADAALGEVGLDERGDHLPPQSRAASNRRGHRAGAGEDPRVVLADEPTGNLDSQTGAEIIGLLATAALTRGTTVIVATHDASLAGLAQRRVAMRDGRIVNGVAPH